MSRDRQDAVDPGQTGHIDAPLGARLRIERAARMSRSALADYLGVSVATIQKWENGSQRIPAGRLWQICRRLGLDVAALFVDMPHHVIGEVAGLAESAPDFDHEDTRAKRAAALARTAAGLPLDRLEVAETLIRALKSTPR
ncbi:MAG: helix-turn-helix domain-containing protein [Alphaproteobacteria bacterium]|nr:helix-turn-helix domain-containing protein [Alphaproteobacteria bacterium]MBU2379836.1 helix-turn-helix domain-containing protein [Alphaproteobacteria bacterium]